MAGAGGARAWVGLDVAGNQEVDVVQPSDGKGRCERGRRLGRALGRVGLGVCDVPVVQGPSPRLEQAVPGADRARGLGPRRGRVSLAAVGAGDQLPIEGVASR